MTCGPERGTPDPIRLDQGDDHDMVVFGREMRSVRRAREWLRAFLGERVPVAQADDAILVVSELVTNALRHGLGDVVVRASIEEPTSVRVSVTDSGPERPALLPLESDAHRRCRPAHRRRGRRLVGRSGVPRRQDRVGGGRFARMTGLASAAAGQLRCDHVREEPTVSATILWIIAAILVIVGIVQLIQGQIILGIVLIVLGLLVGPGGYSLFRPRGRVS